MGGDDYLLMSVWLNAFFYFRCSSWCISTNGRNAAPERQMVFMRIFYGRNIPEVCHCQAEGRPLLEKAFSIIWCSYTEIRTDALPNGSHTPTDLATAASSSDLYSTQIFKGHKRFLTGRETLSAIGRPDTGPGPVLRPENIYEDIVCPNHWTK